MTERNHTIDILRFIAASMVVFFHLNEPIPYIHNFYRSIVKFGHLGVPVFFVISGYCILLSLNASKNSLDFILRRFFRIFPAYWLSLIIVIIAAVFQKVYLGDNSVNNIPTNATEYLKTIFLFTHPFGDTPTINWVYWSLTCELFFYFVVALCFSINKRLFLVLTMVTALSLISNPKGSIFLFWLPHWFSFMIGACIFSFHQNKTKHYIIYIAVLLCLIGLYKFHFNQSFYAYPILTIITSSIIFMSPNFKIKENLFSKAGDFSYSIYLIHVPIGIYILGIFKNEVIQTNILFNILFDLSVYLFVGLISYFMYKYIELPFIKLGKKIIHRNLS